MRLPAYRFAHLRRYHPYPRYRPSRALYVDDSLVVSTRLVHSSLFLIDGRREPGTTVLGWMGYR